MPSDPDHVLDAIDGVVDEWLAMSDDSMRWAPPEKTPPKSRLALPVPPLPQIFEDLLQEVGVQAQTAIGVFRPLGEGVVDAFTAFLDNSAVRHLIELTHPPEDHALLDEDHTPLDAAERGELQPEQPPPYDSTA